MSAPITVAVLDNDPWSARSLAQWIENSAPSTHVIWQTSSAAEALHRCLYGMHKPDVLILDMALNDASGPSVCMQIRKSTSSMGIIGVTAYDPEQYVDDLAQAGAQALVAKERLAADLKKLLPVVAKGESSNPTVFMTTVQAHGKLAQQTQNQASLQRLSARELQVLRRYAHDASTAEIASELGVTANTVFTYMHRISQKLGVKNRLEAIKACKKYDLL